MASSVPGFNPSTIVRPSSCSDGGAYVGRSMTLYCDPEVSYGSVRWGGIRISHMSDIDKATTLSLTVTRSKLVIRIVWVVGWRDLQTKELEGGSSGGARGGTVVIPVDPLRPSGTSAVGPRCTFSMPKV